ncbi:MAG: GDP-L-fucose synthase [Candidatus Heimdallarchaeota archaeon]|nr:GDP-L-fucose synthase [Candidatus Heimdallarchaeota archaeon]
MNKNDRIFVAGHNGMVGSAIVRKLTRDGYTNLILKTRKELDLTNQHDVNRFFQVEKPDYVFLAAAKVGGIHANNTYPAQFIYQNLMIQNNIIHASHENDVKKLLFLGSSCVYPKNPQLPINENSLLTGELEKTNEAYAIAKIAGIKMCEFYRKEYGNNFISVMPTNLYGPNDNYHPENSHVMAALIRKVVLAREQNEPNIILWGSGKPLREFLHVDDLADACVFLMEHYNSPEIINIGSGKEISIFDLAQKIMKIAEYKGEIIFDDTKPDGTYRKVMDVSKLQNLGWNLSIGLDEGITRTILDFEKELSIKQ